jgi:CHAT domain-containing protein
MATCCLLGGANHVVVGDGAIDDEYTGRTIALMLPLLQGGTDPAAALAAAQISLLRDHPTLTPAEWAGLRIIGA